jgi:hypothetical protein
LKIKKYGRANLNVRPHAAVVSTATRLAEIFAAVFAARILSAGYGTGKVSGSGYYGGVLPQKEKFQLQGNCALICIYRPGSTAGALTSRSLNMVRTMFCPAAYK